MLGGTEGKPLGSLTFLFTDVEGSTALWEAAPTAMRDDLARHDSVLAAVVDAHRGSVFKFRGDGIAAVFDQPTDAVAAAVDGQRTLGGEHWRAGRLRVRMGLHTGAADGRDGDWFGPTVNRAARLQDVAHGGQIVLSRATAQLVASDLPTGVALVDLGEHRLRDLLEPERIHQVVAPDLGTHFSPLRTAHHPSRGVPTPTGALLGRSEEAHRLAALVRDHRVVTITGPPGAGKSRLAVELARTERDQWSGGIWFCTLASLPAGTAGGPPSVAGRLLDLVGVDGGDSATALDGVIGALADRRALVILDGCEHVIDDAVCVVQALADRCPGVVVVATSRERLDVPGEHLLELATLDSATALDLFVERARAVRSDFDPADHRDALPSLINHLDGLPLAVELAAARIRTHAPSEMDELLGQHARVLRVPHRRQRAADGAGHHDLEAAISWSYDLLDPLEQRVFRNLAVFAGAFTAANATAVLADIEPSTVADALDGLVERSLLASATIGGAGRETRFRLLATLRSYARRRLDASADRSMAWDRWTAAVLARLEAAAGRLSGPDEARWVAEIADLWEDVRAVHHRACREQDVATAVRVIARLAHHGPMRRPEIGDWGDATLALPGVWAHPGAPWMAALTAEVHLRRGHYDTADALAAEAIERAPADDAPWLAYSTRMLVGYLRGSYGTGARFQEALYAAADRPGTDPLGPAVAAYMHLIVLLYAGRDAEASAPLARLRAIADRTGCPSIRAMASLSEGRLRQADDPVSARAAMRDGLELALSVDNTLVTAQARWALADLSATDDPAGALDELRAMLAEFRATDDNAQLQQALVRSLGPLISLEADEAALLVAGALDGTVWAHAVRYLAGLSRLQSRTSEDDRAAAVVRAHQLGLEGVVDAVVDAVDRLDADR